MIDLKNIDRSRAFTDAEQEEVNKLPREQWYAAMARPNSAETMTLEERLKHYQSKNFPVIKYGPAWTLTPPKARSKI